jgi:hypothetical protein
MREATRETLAANEELYRLLLPSVSWARPKGLILDLCVPPEHAEDRIYHLLGRYDRWVEKHGARKARLIFAAQSVGCVLSFWTDWLLRRVKLFQLLRRS